MWRWCYILVDCVFVDSPNLQQVARKDKCELRTGASWVKILSKFIPFEILNCTRYEEGNIRGASVINAPFMSHFLKEKK